MLFPDASGGAGIARLSAVFARPLGFEPCRRLGFLRGFCAFLEDGRGGTAAMMQFEVPLLAAATARGTADQCELAVVA